MARYSSDFVTIVATIAARAQRRWQFLSPEDSAKFAWFSCNEIGDASVDNADLRAHFKAWVEVEGFDIPEWMI